MKLLVPVRTPNCCRLVIVASKFEGNHGPNLLEIVVKGHFYLQLNPKTRREQMGLSGKLTPEVMSTLLVQTKNPLFGGQGSVAQDYSDFSS